MDALESEYLRDHLNEYYAIVESDDQDHGGWNGIGVTYMQLGRLSCAKKPLLKALKLQPRNPDYWFNVGLLYDKYNKKDLAVRLYNIALELQPRHRHSLFNLSIHFAQNNQIEEALSIWKQLIKEHPYDFSAYSCLADYYVENQEFSKIVDLLEPFRSEFRIINRRKDLAILWFIARKYYEIGEYQLAKEITTELFQYESKYFDFPYTLADIHLKEKNYSEALIYLEKALIIEPFNQEAQNQRLLIKAILDCPDFLEVLEKTIHVHPEIALKNLEDETFGAFHSNPKYKKIVKQARTRKKRLSKLVFVDGSGLTNNPFLRQLHYKQLNIVYNFLRLLGFSSIVFFFDGMAYSELEYFTSYYEEFFSLGIIQEIKPNNSSIHRMLPIIAQITKGIVISNKEFFKYTKDKTIIQYLKKNQITYLLNHEGLFLQTKMFSHGDEFYKAVLYKSVDDLHDEK